MQTSNTSHCCRKRVKYARVVYQGIKRIQTSAIRGERYILNDNTKIRTPLELLNWQQLIPSFWDN